MASTPARSPQALMVLLIATSGPALANRGLVARDGTLGSGALEVAAGIDPLGQAADYLITPELGEHHGVNLFRSFARFDIGAGETATFTGPDPISGPQSLAVIDGATLETGTTGIAASGHAGTIRITATDSVVVKDRALIGAGSWGGQGDGGTVSIEARTVTLDGSDQYAVLHAGIEETTLAPPLFAGTPGTIEVTAEFLGVLNGATIQNGCWS
jgi:hypothetical protein